MAGRGSSGGNMYTLVDTGNLSIVRHAVRRAKAVTRAPEIADIYRMTESPWMNDWRVRVRVWIERHGEAVLGEGKAELLATIERDKSITRAAKSLRMSYRRGWSMVQSINAAAGEPLVETAAGGMKGGGARLTPRGRLALEVYEQLRQSLVGSASAALQRAVGTDSAAATTVHVAAAISLQEAVGQILAEFALHYPAIHVRTIFGASNELADHLLAGAPGDVFLSAEPAEVNRLEAAGLVAAKSRLAIARNGLAAIGVSGLKPIRNVRDLASNKVRRLALADSAAPLGRCSDAYLRTASAYEKLAPKVLRVDNSRAVLAAVSSKTVDVGLAFSSDATRRGGWQLLFRVPLSKAAAIYEAAAICRDEPSTEAEQLLQFLGSPAAQRCLRRCGLRPIAP
jgi:molybdenum ABC transporter molybdate-binding protein